MKNDTSKTIDLDSLFEQQETKTNLITESTDTHDNLITEVTETQPAITANFEAIVEEWSWGCPKGFPTIVDGKFAVREEVEILNQILIENKLNPISLPEATPKKKLVAKAPVVKVADEPKVTDKTSLKESMVCLFYDALGSGKLNDSVIKKIHKEALTKKAAITVTKKDIDDVIKILETVWNSKSKNYNSDFNSVEFISWTYNAFYALAVDPKAPLNKKTVSENIQTINNSVSSARAIEKDHTYQTIIREKTFNEIRSKAVELAASELGVQQLKPDNWCPGDVYLVQDINVAKKATKAPSLNKNTSAGKSLNSYFAKNLTSSTIVACSLKEETAQAGKATEFLPKVFSATYKSNVNTEEVKTDLTVKEINALNTSIKRFKEYSPDFPNIKGIGRQKSYFNAFTTTTKGVTTIDVSINKLLKYGKQPLIKTKDLVITSDSNKFKEKNKTVIDSVIAAIEAIETTLKDQDVLKTLAKKFTESRNRFIKSIKSKKYATVNNVNTESFLKSILDSEKSESYKINVISKKIGTYDLATSIIDKWISKDKGNQAYVKLRSLKNPFAALTAFAVAEAGINPGFWKYIGTDTGDVGHGHWFERDAAVDIDDKTGDIKLLDTEENAGFSLTYTTKINKDLFETILAFRYSDDSIRIEVNKLEKI